MPILDNVKRTFIRPSFCRPRPRILTSILRSWKRTTFASKSNKLEIWYRNIRLQLMTRWLETSKTVQTNNTCIEIKLLRLWARSSSVQSSTPYQHWRPAHLMPLVKLTQATMRDNNNSCYDIITTIAVWRSMWIARFRRVPSAVMQHSIAIQSPFLPRITRKTLSKTSGSTSSIGTIAT